MIRLVRAYGLRRGISIWRLQRAWRAERAIAGYQAEHGQPWRTHHGAKPDRPGHQRR